MSSGDLLVTLDKSCLSLKLCSYGFSCVQVGNYQWEVQTDEGWTLYWEPQA
jgi:hypothetical protein